MKVLFNKIYKMDEEYQENLLDGNNFDRVTYTEIRPQVRNVKGLTYNDVYILEPESFYQISLKTNIPYNFEEFTPNIIWVKAGLIFSKLYKKDKLIFVYNITKNHIYLRPDAIIGEIL